MKNKTTLFFIVVGLLLLGIIIALIFLSFQPQKEAKPVVNPTPFPSPTLIPVTLTLEKITPDDATTLPAGKPFAFTISFTTPIELNQIDFTLTYTDDFAQNPSPIPVKIIPQKIDQRTISLQTTDPIQPAKEYALTIVNATTNDVLSSTSYPSERPLPTKVPTNNLTLASFLPYETDLYSLIYLENRNIYVFRFKYNADSSVSSDEQFNAAKADAVKFIESKGIDLKTIVIEWRSS